MLTAVLVLSLQGLAPSPHGSESEDLARRLAGAAEEAGRPYLGDAAPGCAIAVMLEGKTVFEKGFGLADLEHDVAIDPDSVFDLGSTSKQFTAACIALLELEGKLSLEDDVRRYVPELPDVGATITLRHLLLHTSGVRDYIPLLMIGGADEADLTSPKDALAALARQRGLCFEPGARHEYSNSGYFLLAQVVERVSGMPIAAFARERLFEPLGMEDTHFHDDHTLVVRNRAIGYEPKGRDGYSIHMSNWTQTGDGAVMSTVRDVLKWAANFESGTVGGKPFLDLMDRRGALDDGTAIRYGMGLFHDEYGAHHVVRHGGAWAGYRAELLRVPDLRLAIVCLTNRGDAQPSLLVDAIVHAALGDPPPPVALDQVDVEVDVEVDGLEPLVGLWLDPDDETLLKLVLAGGSLALGEPGGARRLVALAADRFATPDGAVKLERIAGDPPGLRRRGDFGVSSPLRRVERWKPTAEELAALAGAYRSDEVGTEIEIALDGDRATLRIGDAPPFPLAPRDRDAFESPLGVLRLERDAAGGVALSPRTRGFAGIRFVRAAPPKSDSGR